MVGVFGPSLFPPGARKLDVGYGAEQPYSYFIDADIDFFR